MLRRWLKTRDFREIGGGCPMCGRELDDSSTRHNSDLAKKLENAHNQLDMLNDKMKLQEQVIKEQIKGIYEYIKSKNS